MTADEKYQLRKDSGYITRGLIWYSIVCSIVVSMVEISVLRKAGFAGLTAESSAFSGYAVYGSIAAVLTGVLFMLFREGIHGKKITAFEKTGRKMKVRTLGKYMIFFLAAQFVFSAAVTLVEALLNAAGFTMTEMIEFAGTGTGVGMVVYTGFAGPVAEEIIYRGLVMKGLMKYGKAFALIVSSVLFGLMHGNPIQIFFGTAVGMLLGYAAMEYSLWWAVFLHIMNNFLFGEVLLKFLNLLPERASNILFVAVLGIAFIAGAILILRKKKELAEWFRINASPKECYVNAFTTPSAIIFIVFSLLTAVSMLLMIKPV